jgi:hypothetical protein
MPSQLYTDRQKICPFGYLSLHYIPEGLKDINVKKYSLV